MPETLLLVEDDKNISRLLQYNLEKAGFNIFIAHSGEEALTLVEDKEPDLIILDIMLPGMDGLEVCRHLKRKKETAHIPVVMLTAITHELNRKLSENVMGASGYITKPFTADVLLSTIRELLLVKK